MATSSEKRKLQKLQEENKRLRADNKKLLRAQAVSTNGKAPRGSLLKKIAAILCISFAVALLLVGNVLFWAGNTVVKTDRYVESTEPIIKDPIVQDAIADNATQKLFENVDVDQLTEQALPPRLAFLAPTLSEQVKQKTDDTIRSILKRPQFQDRWNDAQERSHARFIRLVEANGSDGSIDISEVYTDISQQLKSTKLAFLADKPLPAKVGNVELVSGSWLTALQKTIQNIDTWRTIAIVLLIIFSILGVWLSRKRRKTVIVLGSFFAFTMFFTLVGGRLAREIIAGKVDPQYAEAARQVYTIVVHPLVVQTATLLVAALLVVFIAWISGPYRSSKILRLKIDQLFSGKIHDALFGRGENQFTNWLGRNKKALEWIVVGLVACSALLVRLTPKVLLLQIIIILVAVLLIEVLAAKPQKPR